MKMRILYFLFLLTGSGILFVSASGGAAEVQNRDRTMSPLSENSSCATCHNSGDFSPTLNVQLLDGDAAITTYEPGKTYTLSVAIEGADAATGYGFQAVLLSGTDNVNAGMFGTPAAGIQVETLNDRMYAEHSARSTSSSWTIDWTAPETGVDSIRIYVGGNAVDGNGSTQGDNGLFLANPVVVSEAETSKSDDRLLTFDGLQIAPNPTQSGATLTIDNSQSGRYTMRLFNAMGQNLQTQLLDLVQGTQSQWIDLQEQPKGLYFLQLSNGRQQLTRKILKQ